MNSSAQLSPLPTQRHLNLVVKAWTNNFFQIDSASSSIITGYRKRPGTLPRSRAFRRWRLCRPLLRISLLHSLMVDESMVKSASQGISAGCGVRVVSGERTGYAYTDDLSASRILHAARTAALIASAPAKTRVAGFQQTAARSLYPVTLPSVDAEITASRTRNAGRQGCACLRPAYSGSPRQLLRRTAEYSCRRLRRNICRRFPAARPHERVLHRKNRKQFGSRRLRRRRTRGSRFFLW